MDSEKTYFFAHLQVYISLGYVFPSLTWNHRDNCSCHIFSPDTIQDYKKSHKSSCFWKIYSKIFWPDKLDKLTSDLYLKWTALLFKVYHRRYHQKVAHTAHVHWQERALAGSLKRNTYNSENYDDFFHASVPSQSFHWIRLIWLYCTFSRL